MNHEDITLSEISQLQKGNSYMIHLYKVFKVLKFMETENKMVATRGHVMEKKESSCSLGIGKLSVMHDEKVLELFHKSVNILSMTEVVT